VALFMPFNAWGFPTYNDMQRLPKPLHGVSYALPHTAREGRGMEAHSVPFKKTGQLVLLNALPLTLLLHASRLPAFISILP